MFGSCLVMQYLSVHSSFAIISLRKIRLVVLSFILIVILLICGCYWSMSLHHCAVGYSVVCPGVS